MKKAVLIAPILILGGCATPTLQTPTATRAEVASEAELQRKFVVQHQVEQQIVLRRVMYKLTTGAADFCSDNLTGALGAFSLSAAMFPTAERNAARDAYDLDNGLTVVAVMPDSPAEQAGIRVGDHIFSIAGNPIRNAEPDTRSLGATLKNAAVAGSAISIVVTRGRENIPLSATPAPACDYPASINDDDDINAAADGQQIVVNKGMMNFVKSDQELATVLSHEMSHNILHHIDKKKENMVVGGLAGLALDILVIGTTGVNPGLYRSGEVIGAQAYSIQFEQEADYEGMYVMQHAGYDLEGAANFWRRMAAETPSSITMRTTHPTSPERFLAIQTAIAEIDQKRVQGLAMLPNAQPGKDAPAVRIASVAKPRPQQPSVGLVPTAVPPTTTAMNPKDSGTQTEPIDDAVTAYNRRDYGAAFRIFRPLAEQGNARAQHNLSVMYTEGQGVRQNYAEAVRWARLAADQGYAQAQTNLGVKYFNGQGVPQNYSEAVKWFRLAAAQGNSQAQSNLGLSYQNGQGVQRDLVKAHMWTGLAASQSTGELSKNASDRLNQLASEMTAAQIAFAEKSSAKCKSSEYKDCGEAIAPSGSNALPARTPQPTARDTGAGVQVSLGQNSRPSLNSNTSGTHVALVKDGGTYSVPVLINGVIPLNFTVDSGSADVSIPGDVVLTLIRTGTLKPSDFVGEQTFRLADGSTIKSRTFVIRSLKVGDTSITDVQASVADVRGELLLGQSFLEKFKSWSMDNSTHELVLQ